MGPPLTAAPLPAGADCGLHGRQTGGGTALNNGAPSPWGSLSPLLRTCESVPLTFLGPFKKKKKRRNKPHTLKRALSGSPGQWRPARLKVIRLSLPPTSRTFSSPQQGTVYRAAATPAPVHSGRPNDRGSAPAPLRCLLWASPVNGALWTCPPQPVPVPQRSVHPGSARGSGRRKATPLLPEGRCTHGRPVLIRPGARRRALGIFPLLGCCDSGRPQSLPPKGAETPAVRGTGKAGSWGPRVGASARARKPGLPSAKGQVRCQLPSWRMPAGLRGRGVPRD